MQVTYNWVIDTINAKKSFTDKYGNLRENAIKSVRLFYVGKQGDREEKASVMVNFKLIDLRDFKSVDEITKEELLIWCLNTMHPKEKEGIERSVRSKFGSVVDDNVTSIIINE